MVYEQYKPMRADHVAMEALEEIRCPSGDSGNKRETAGGYGARAFLR